MGSDLPALISAKQAAEIYGYGTVARWRAAVDRGKAPPPYDTGVRPHLWKRDDCDAMLLDPPKSRHDAEVLALDRRMGLD